MSSYGLPPANSAGSPVSGGTTTQYSRVDLQAAFNWLVNQPDHVRKQASDPDRLMTLYYRSSGRGTAHSETTRVDSMRAETVRVESSRMENEAPVSSQNFLSDLRQINEALRQFETPGSQSHNHSQSQSHSYVPHSSANHSSTQQTVIHTAPPTVHIHNSVPSMNQNQAPQVTAHAGAIGMALNGRTQAVLMEVREKLNLSSETEALQMLVAIGYKQLKPMID
ncbi:MAG: hypothetical protein U1E10_07300 [Bdellovibrionales bacterium]|nr:hypothetical protein [Bdellovibrionales bacterium]